MTGILASATNVIVLAGLAVLAAVITLSWTIGYRAPTGPAAGRGTWMFSLPGWARAVMALLGIASTIYIAATLWVRLPVAVPAAADRALWLVGLACFLGGTALAIWGRVALGSLWTTTTALAVQLHAGHRLVTHGPFALVRHPMYAGAFWLVLGLLLIYRTWGVAVLWGLSVVSFGSRALREERILHDTFGEEWRRYAQRVPRWFPRWRRAA